MFHSFQIHANDSFNFVLNSVWCFPYTLLLSATIEELENEIA